jgi:hypothetical protein
VTELYIEGFKQWAGQTINKNEADKEEAKNLKYLEWFCEALRVPIEVISKCMDSKAYKEYEASLEV